jgi:hypothetical protein
MSLAIVLAPIVAGGATHFASASSPAPSWIAVRDTTGCLDTLHASDTISAVVTMSVRPQDPNTKLPADFEGLFVQEIGSRLKVQGSLPLRVMVGWGPCDANSEICPGAVLTIGSSVYVTAHPTGALSRIGVIDFSLTPSFSDSVRAVLERIGREKMSPPLFGRNDSIPLTISIGVQQNYDAIPPHRRLFRVNLPHYSLPFTYAKWPKNAKRPNYPSNAERIGVGDSVTVSLTILADGTVAPNSVDVQSGRYIDFMKSVFDVLGKTRYLPARVGGCPVAAWGMLSFTFKVR